jgi:hypothetical protein
MLQRLLGATCAPAYFLASIRHLTASYVGLGYAAFATTMTIGRLAGDRIVHKPGPKRIVRLEGMVAALGFLSTIPP